MTSLFFRGSLAASLFGITDGNSPTVANATIDLLVGGPVVASDDDSTVEENSSVFISVMDNDQIVTTGSISLEIVSDPTNGFVYVDEMGVFYVPDDDFVGTDTFVYSISDPVIGLSSQASVTVHVEAAKYLYLDWVDDQEGVKGEQISIELGVLSSTDLISYSATGLPPGLEIDIATGEISGVLSSGAAQNSPYTITVTAQNEADGILQAGFLTDQITFQWVVRTLIVSNPGDQDGKQGDTVWVGMEARAVPGAQLTWSATGLPNGLAIDPDSGGIAGLIVPGSGSSEPYSVTVSAVDDFNNSASTTFAWLVNPISLFAPDDQFNHPGAITPISIDGFDQDSLPLTYSATQLPPGLIIDSVTGDISGTISAEAVQDDSYEVVVTASNGTQTSEVAFSWTVWDIWTDAPATKDVLAEVTTSRELIVENYFNKPLKFRLVDEPEWMSIDEDTGTIAATPPSSAASADPYLVTLVISDDSITPAPDIYSFTMLWSVDEISLAKPSDQVNGIGENVYLKLSGQFPAGADVTFSASNLPLGLVLDEETGVISGSIEAGSSSNQPYVVTVTAEVDGLTRTQEFTWSVRWFNIAAVDDQDSLEGDVVAVALYFETDGPGPDLSWSATGLPTGLQLDVQNSQVGIYGTIADLAAANDPYLVTIALTDGTFTATQLILWKVDNYLLITDPGPQIDLLLSEVSLAIEVEAPLGSDLTFTAEGLPDGLEIDPETGIISGTLVTSENRDHTVTVSVTDGVRSAEMQFAWITEGIFFLKPEVQLNARSEENIQVHLHAIDLRSTRTIQYVLADGSSLPPGLQLNTVDGSITGSIESNASLTEPYHVVIHAQALDANADVVEEAEQSFDWVIVNNAITITSLADPHTLAARVIELQIEASGSANSDLTYKAIGLPDGLSINSVSGLISGMIPETEANTDSKVVVTVRNDAGDAAAISFRWYVGSINHAPTLDDIEDQVSKVGDAQSLLTSATDEDQDSLTYEVIGLPEDFTISSGGIIGGTFTEPGYYSEPGSYQVTVKASDGTFTTSKTFNWTVRLLTIDPIAPKRAPKAPWSPRSPRTQLPLITASPFPIAPRISRPIWKSTRRPASSPAPLPTWRLILRPTRSR